MRSLLFACLVAANQLSKRIQNVNETVHLRKRLRDQRESFRKARVVTAPFPKRLCVRLHGAGLCCAVGWYSCVERRGA